VVNDSDIFVDFDDLCKHSVIVVSAGLPAVRPARELLDNSTEFGDETLNLENGDLSQFFHSLLLLGMDSW